MITTSPNTITTAEISKPIIAVTGRRPAASLAMLILLAIAACESDDTEAAADAAVAPQIDAADQDTWTSFASGFFESYCQECHGPGDSLRDYSLLPTVHSETAKIRCGVSADSLTGCTIPARQFPIGAGPTPTDDERMRLVKWIEDGAREL